MTAKDGPEKAWTAKSVKNLMPRKGRSRDTRFDPKKTPPGFGIRISTGGEKPVRSFVVVYRVHARKRWLKLGDVAALGLGDARTKARAELLRVANGEDPAATKGEERKAGSFAALVEAYIDHGADERSDKTTADYGRQARTLAGTALGKMPAPAVTRAAVREYLEDVAEDAPVMANRLLALIRATCRWAVGRDRLPTDPTTGIERPGVEAPTRTRLDDDQIRQLWKALDSPADDETLSPEVIACIKTLVLLGTRRTETARMRWADLDLDATPATWTIPSTDRKGGRALVVPLPQAVVDLLTGLRDRTGEHAYAFAGKRGGPLSSNPSRWSDAVRRACGIDFSPHALRRTFARGVARLGTSSELISRLLGHKVVAGTLAVTENYAEFDFLPERASALNAWAAHVAAVVSGKERKADVLPIASGRRSKRAR